MFRPFKLKRTKSLCPDWPSRSRANPQKVFSGNFLARIKTVSGQEDLAYRVESVVIFGSYLKGVPHLNDLDLGVELIGKWNDDASYHSACRPSMERARSSGRRFRNVVDEVCWPRTEVLLLLKNRSRTISLCEWDSLKNMPELRYCVLVELPVAVEAAPLWYLIHSTT